MFLFIGGKPGQPFLTELAVGPNPPPPAPTECSQIYNEADCHKGATKLACKWCSSDDGVHSLCFDKGHAPKGKKSGWTCGGK